MGPHSVSSAAATSTNPKAGDARMKNVLRKVSSPEKGSIKPESSPIEQPHDGHESWGAYGTCSPSARDISFSNRGGATGGGADANLGPSSSRIFFQHHARSASQASTGSGSRVGQFVHPRMQTPQTATQPVPYANSMHSADNNVSSREYSPTTAEFEDDEGHLPRDDRGSYARLVSPHYYHAATFQPPIQRPSFGSQHTASFSDLASPPPLQLRVNTSVVAAKPVSRLAHGGLSSLPSLSDIHGPGSGGGNVDSPTASISGNNTTAPLATQPLASPISTHSIGTAAPAVTSLSDQTMPVRRSLEAAVLPARLRSRSDMDTEQRQRKIREARRKFQEKERKEQDKEDRRRIREREELEAKKARRIEAAARKTSFSAAASRGASMESTRPSLVSRRSTSNSLALAHQQVAPGGTISASASASASVFSVLSPVSGKRKSSGTGPSSSYASTALESPGVASWRDWAGGRGEESGSASGRRSLSRRHTEDCHSTAGKMREKPINFGQDYNTVPENPEALPAFGMATAGDVRFERQTRPNKPKTAKRKTQGYWHGFILWLRTKLMRLGGH